MKAILIILTTTIILASSGCKKPIDAPPCIKTKIEQAKKAGYLNAVKEYIFKNMTVYVFEGEPFPDAGDLVYDQSCNQVCSLGGLGGNITCMGENFGNNAKLIRTIWEK